MRFAEVFLRLGVSLVAWMVVYAYVVWLAALNSIGCGPDGDELHRLMLGFAPFAAGAAFLLGAANRIDGMQGLLRWLGAPLAVLVPLALLSIWTVFVRSNVSAYSICADHSGGGWHSLWAPLQLLTVVIIAYRVLRMIKVEEIHNNEGN